MLERFSFVIHPIIYEYLLLNTDSQDLVLGYTWNYMKENESQTMPFV